MKVVAIIQARMKSTRLPGKVLMPLGGRPVLEHIIERLRRARTIDQIAITTSTEPEDDAIAAFGKAHGVTVSRGREDDVLGRYEAAAKQTGADIVVRVTGDSPLIDPWFVDFLVLKLQEENADFLVLADGIKCIQEGVDPFTSGALDTIVRRARNDPVAREHVTAWLKLHPEAARVVRFAIPRAYEFSARLSVDTPADVKFFEALAERIDLTTASLIDVADLLRREPWLMTINAHVHQKAPTQQAATVLLRADGGGKLGLGHLMRAVALGEALRETAGLGVVALSGVHPDGDADLARQVFAEHKIPVITMPVGTTEEIFIIDEARRTKARAVAFDVRTPLPRVALEQMRILGLATIVIDDASDRRLAADLAIYPPVPQAAELDWKGFRGECLIGAEYVVLSPAIARASRQRRTHIAKAPRILISMGGSDPAGLTAPIAMACSRAVGADMPIDVVVGPAVQDISALKAALAKTPGIIFHQSPRDIAALYAQTSLAIVSFGVTSYELGALGVPALYVALTEDHRNSAMGAQAAGFGRFVTMAAGNYAAKIAGEAARLISNGKELVKMASAGRAAIDGGGAQRIAAKVAALITREAAPQARSASAEMLEANRPAAVGE